jgi:hypothetical protein
MSMSAAFTTTPDATPGEATVAAAASGLSRPGHWLISPFYDLAFIILSAAVILFPHLTFQLIGKNIYVDLIVTVLIGGPHLFATYTMTFMEPRFRQRYPRYTWGALVLPPLIITLAILDLTLLVTMFFFWASIHVIHQVMYVTDAYRMKDPRGWTWPSRIIDYGLLATALYPIGTEKLMGGQFVTGGRVLLFPSFLKTWWVGLPIWIAFAGFAAAFAVRAYRDQREGRLHVARTLLVALSSVLFFVTPMLANLDVAFQGLNTWHSFQYLALVLYLNRFRSEQGFIGTKLVERVSRRGWSLYAMCLGFTLLAGVAYFATLLTVVKLGAFATGGPFKMLFVGTIASGQHFFAFYSVILSCLLVHYYFDHFIFLQRDKVITPSYGRLQDAIAA